MTENTTPLSAERSRLWADPRNWNRDGSYNCAEDSRLLVRARAAPGWTLNMAHPRAQLTLWIFLLVVIAFVTGLGLVLHLR